MPTSHFNQINEIIELISLTKPAKILDIGIGYGKYGFLSREYLEIWGEETEYNKRNIVIDGIEGHKEYITDTHNKIYNNIFLGNAIDVLPGLRDKYDLILLIDVIEHFTYQEGQSLLQECLLKGENVIISTPKDIYFQGDVFNNPLEEHKFQWEKEHFRKLGDCFFIPNRHSLICYIGSKSEQVKQEISTRKRKDTLLMFKVPVKKLLSKYKLLNSSKRIKKFLFKE
jgi:hypothetical protein